MTVSQAAETAQKARIHPHAAFVLVVAALLAVMAGLTLGSHEVYEAVAAGNGIEQLDQPALATAVADRSAALTDTAVTFTALAGRLGTPLLGLVAIALFTWRRRDWTPTVLLVTGLLGSLAITVIGKNASGRVRPPREFALPPFETSPSFPSGHTLNATVLACLVAYLALITLQRAWARWAVVTLCVVHPVIVALSRVYLGQHWLTDVIAGALIGGAWALGVVLAHRVWLQMRHHRRRGLTDLAGSHPGPRRARPPLTAPRRSGGADAPSDAVPGKDAPGQVRTAARDGADGTTPSPCIPLGRAGPLPSWPRMADRRQPLPGMRTGRGGSESRGVR